MKWMNVVDEHLHLIMVFRIVFGFNFVPLLFLSQEVLEKQTEAKDFILVLDGAILAYQVFL